MKNCNICDEETERINLNLKYKTEGLDATGGAQKPCGLRK